MNSFRVDPVLIDSKEARESQKKVQDVVGGARQQLDALIGSWQPIELAANKPHGHELDAQKASNFVLLAEIDSTSHLPA